MISCDKTELILSYWYWCDIFLTNTLHIHVYNNSGVQEAESVDDTETEGNDCVCHTFEDFAFWELGHWENNVLFVRVLLNL